ncbi:MAG: BatA domain-containing protein, partial [Methylocystis sp.]|nr:BatA domain-containing protein [Methylocystis sp.]
MGLMTLPVIWLLLRVTPPRPREIIFPPTKILRELKPDEQAPAKTPWWLLALRLAIAAAIIIAMAGPVWSPQGALAISSAPTFLIVDDGWSAAPTWEKRLAAGAGIIEAAGRAGAPIAVAAISESAAPVLTDSAHALEKLRSMRPKPFLPDRRAAGEQLKGIAKARPGARIVWISDALDEGGAKEFAQALTASGARVEIYADDRPLRALAAPANDAASLSVDVLRLGDTNATVVALDAKGQVVGRASVDFFDAPRAKAKIDLPVELRNEVSALRIESENSAGAVALLDARSRVKRVALVSGSGFDETQPLLSPLYYLEKAMAPFAQLRQARPGAPDPVASLLAEKPNIVALADVSLAPGETSDLLAKFVDEGGTLIRFAGSRLANAADDLLPVRLRRNGRVLGGAMSWETPKSLAEFDVRSPFFGLPASKDVSVQRQVLAEPDQGLVQKTWARLSDGTPLVTAERRGKGMIVLFHVNADTTWSNLPISGLFVEMLKRISAMASDAAPVTDEIGTTTASREREQTLAPLRTLDGFGILGAPAPTAQPIAADFTGPASAEHPPGLYGAGDAFVAVQTLLPNDTLTPFDFAAAGLAPTTLQAGKTIDFRAPLLAAALIAFIADALLSLILSGKLRLRSLATAGAALMLIASAHTDR